jgi:hypothetical protein
MSLAYSAFAKVGRRIVQIPTPGPRLPRLVALLALVVAIVLATLPLASSIRDRAADARIASIDATDRAGDFGPITED